MCGEHASRARLLVWRKLAEVWRQGFHKSQELAVALQCCRVAVIVRDSFAKWDLCQN